MKFLIYVEAARREIPSTISASRQLAMQRPYGVTTTRSTIFYEKNIEYQSNTRHH